ncbi:MAG TPA: cation:proton antiporter [Chloroflexota bacterium]|nr:cation:proton antiporter [Chloroflexota bacterium]
MGELHLVVDLVLAVLAAFVGGLLAQRLGLPVILGYLLAGVAIGPFTPGPVADIHSVQVLAEIGVAFLMFALGAEFALGELRQLGRAAALGGTLQLLSTTALGLLLAPVLGLSWTQGIFLGALLALSSTVVATKVLLSRGELQTLHGRLALGILIVQDLAVVPMVLVLPALAAGGERLLADLVFTALKAGGVLLGAYLLGDRLVPWLLAHTAGMRSRELFLLGVVGLALGTALVTQLAGLSLAFGAFLAGLVVAESDYRTQVVAEVLPFRDLFASLFFVSVGMLIDLGTLLSHAGLVALLAAVVVLGKASLTMLATWPLGMPGKVALLTGLSLAQVGEFSFVLARIGVDAGAIPTRLFELLLATALVTITLTPFLPRAAPALLSGLERLPRLGKWFAAPVEADPAAAGLRHHTVICGFGRVGRELAEALERRKLRYLAIEYNPFIVQELRARGIPVIYGDAANPAVLDHAHLETARLLAVLVPDARAAELATRYARTLHPRLDIVARATDAADVARLRRAGATEVVQPEFEAAVEVIRHAMQRYGIGGLELTHLTAGRRAAFYRRAAEDTAPPHAP